MSLSPETSAAAAKDAYVDRPQDDPNNPAWVFLNDQKYAVFGYKDDPATGFHGTAYQNLSPPYNVIIAYRGTDPDIKNHTRTTFQDAAVDFTMVKDRVNPQEADARAFTQEMLDKAQSRGISKDQITVAGHSLGGALAEIEASKFGLHGATFNAYGAVDLNYGVPQGGNQVTDYVMAGDVVSAASHHFGEVKLLASPDDIQGLKTARYLDAPAGSQPPNPLLAMSLSDHSMTHFLPDPGSNQISVLSPGLMAQYEQNYQNNKAAVDHYRSDVYNERADLSAVLRDPGSRNLESTYANMSPRMQQQLAEFYAVHVDAPIQSAVEHNRIVQGAEQGLDQTAAALRAGGQGVQQGADHFAQNAHTAGQNFQHAADALAEGAQRAPLDPVTAFEVSLGAKATGFVARTEADGVALTSHLAGQATKVTADYAAAKVHQVEQTVQRDAHIAAEATKAVVHAGEVAAVGAADYAINTYEDAKAAAQVLGDRATQAYEATRQTVSQGIDAAEHNASQAYDKLTHPEQWFQNTPSAPAQTNPAHAPAKPDNSRYDPRNPASPDHGLFNAMKEYFPGTSDDRLLQFTAACHERGINEKNLQTVFYNDQKGVVLFSSRGLLSETTVIDVKPAPPPAEQSIQQIQHHDQQQALNQAQYQTQQAQINQQQGR
jgi:hypothetical protein